MRRVVRYTNNIMKHKHLGFTVVELLVIIVVIGILAAITIVSYSYLSKNAEAAAAGQEMSQMIKVVESYQAKYGKLPGGSTSLGLCMSSDTTACNGNYIGSPVMTTAVFNELKSVGLGAAPALKPYGKTYKAGPGLTGNLNAPYLFFSASGVSGVLIIEGDRDCPIGVKNTNSSVYPTPSSSQGATACIIG